MLLKVWWSMFYETETKIRERRDAKTSLRQPADMPTTVTLPVDMSRAVENFRRMSTKAPRMKAKIVGIASN